MQAAAEVLGRVAMSARMWARGSWGGEGRAVTLLKRVLVVGGRKVDGWVGSTGSMA